MKTTSLKQYIEKGALDARLTALYGEQALEWQRARYVAAVASFAALYGERDVWVRPLSMWNEEVERDGIIYKRFTYIGS